MQGGKTRPTRDHTLPRERFRGDGLHKIGVSNVKILCWLCNNQRAAAGHCFGALVCARSVAGDGDVVAVMRRWGFRSSDGETRPGLPDSRTTSDEYIMPAVTAAERVWNGVTLAAYGRHLRKPEAFDAPE